MFFFLLSLILYFSYVKIPESATPFAPNPFLAGVYYLSFMADYIIYCVGFSGVLILCSSFLKYLPEKIKIPFGIIYFLLSIIFLISFPSFPYSNLWLNFFFVTTGIPWSLFLLMVMIILSMTYTFIKEKETLPRLCASIIILFPLILAFVMGIFPRIRTDPSSRHLLPLYPFLSYLLVEAILYNLKGSKIYKTFTLILLLPFLYHLLIAPYHSFNEEKAWREASNKIRIHLLQEIKRKMDVCYYIPDKTYYINSYDHLIFPYRAYKIRFVRVFADDITDIPESEFHKKECENKKERFIFMRWKPEVNPFYERAGREFFRNMEKFRRYPDDQLSMAYYAYMHNPSLTPTELNLRRYYRPVFKAGGRYSSYPLFINELFHRWFYRLPFSIPYEFYFEVYEK